MDYCEQRELMRWVLDCDTCCSSRKASDSWVFSPAIHIQYNTQHCREQQILLTPTTSLQFLMSRLWGGQSTTHSVPLCVRACMRVVFSNHVCFYCSGSVFAIIVMLENEAVANQMLTFVLIRPITPMDLQVSVKWFNQKNSIPTEKVG